MSTKSSPRTLARSYFFSEYPGPAVGDAASAAASTASRRSSRRAPELETSYEYRKPFSTTDTIFLPDELSDDARSSAGAPAGGVDGKETPDMADEDEDDVGEVADMDRESGMAGGAAPSGEPAGRPSGAPRTGSAASPSGCVPSGDEDEDEATGLPFRRCPPPPRRSK